MPRRGESASHREIPPPLELECLKALWALGEGTVRDVREVLVGNRKLAYTTVMTVLDRLEKRGGVSRCKNGRSFVYQPRATQEALRKYAVKELIDQFFGGSEDALREFLMRPRTATSPSDSADSMDASLL
jgi:BlaI family penicillinase repressor